MPVPVPFPIDAVPVGLLVLRAGVVVAVNELATVELGAGVSDLVGRRPGELFEQAERGAVDALVAAAGSRPARVRVHTDAAGAAVVELTVRAEGELVLVAVRGIADERRLAAIVDSLADSTFVLGRSGLVEWQSERLSTRLPRRGVSGIGLNPMDRVHPEDLPRVLEAFAVAVANPAALQRYEIRSRSVDDDDVWQTIEVQGVNLLDHPDVRGLVVQVRNLDEGERVSSVGATDGPHLSLVQALPIGVVVEDAAGHTVFRNAAAAGLLGREDGQDWDAGVSRRDRARLRAAARAALDEGEAAELVVEAEGTKGPCWVRVSLGPQRGGAGGVVGVIATLQDVTHEQEALAEVRRLEDMLDATSDFVAIWRPEGGEVLYLNRALRRVMERLRLAGGTGLLGDLLAPDDRAAFLADANEVLATSDVWRGELRLRTGPDEVRPVSAVGIVRRREDGELDWVAMHARDITDLKEAETRLREMATHDYLTGLPNRGLLNDRLAHALTRQQRDPSGVALLFLDLDGFKEVNDQYGHAVGDQVLVAVARRLRGTLRAADTAARVGGDEFVVLCEGIADADELAALCERVIAALGAPVEAGGSTLSVGVSVGVGVAPTGDTDADRLLTVADTAMYRAKALGGRRWRIALADGDL